MTETLKIAVAGAAGRMGQQLVRAGMDAGHQITGGSEAPGSPHIGKDIGTLAGHGPLGVTAQAGIGEAAREAQVWIDFTVPQATLTALALAPGVGVKAFVIGTTGFTEKQEAEIADASERVAIVKAGNFSLGVNLLEALVKQAAARLGEDWDIEVLETHHRRKIDAPSGTALMLGEAAAEGRGKPLSELRSAPYDGPDAKREPGKIGFAVRRTGGVIGDHEVTFGSDMEIVSLSHTALDRAVFAHGAIKAAEWAARQGPGLYGMDDVLGLR
ncbi:4-hydroxy-tetrahydrodipicolinate reductase [Hyphomonas sp. FCG-A18]|uniref:4-hydroxy-tetrahydrodipicolinate reductase n=1 Tax=Hyphomonas sp. FCG-A18 TaxID=3080019 RepID=UPI002B2EC3C1|nr:4-hydroxy-tetrahydrodipicolinate reductase [Hyphomonas sp. FCG-A18]